MEVRLSEDVVKFLAKQPRNVQQFAQKKILALEQGKLLGDFVFGLDNIDCKELKLKGLRFFYIHYRNQDFILSEDEFKHIIKVLAVARKNKKGEQQKIINSIKEKVKQTGMDIDE